MPVWPSGAYEWHWKCNYNSRVTIMIDDALKRETVEN